MLEELRTEIEALVARGRAKELHVGENRKPPFLNYKGKKLIDFTNWDFFNLNENKKLKRSLQSLVDRVGFGGCSPRISTGTTQLHVKAEEDIAKHFGYESALLFSSKNQAVFTLLTALLNERDIVFADELVQSPVTDAAYLVNAQTVALKMDNSSMLEQELKKAEFNRRKILFLEGISPLSGLGAPISLMVGSARKFGCHMIVDESYSMGWLGLRGAGALESSAMQNEALACVGDLGFGLGLGGAFIAGGSELISYLLNRSRTFQVENAPSPLLASAISEALAIVELMPLERDKIISLSADLKRTASNLGLSATISGHGPILCLTFKKLALAMEIQQALFSKGYLVEASPVGTSLSETAIIRILLNISHTEQQISSLCAALAEALPRALK